MWLQLFVLASCLQFQLGHCGLSKQTFKVEVQAVLEEFLGDYKQTVKQLQSEVAHLKGKVYDLENIISGRKDNVIDSDKYAANIFTNTTGPTVGDIDAHTAEPRQGNHGGIRARHVVRQTSRNDSRAVFTPDSPTEKGFDKRQITNQVAFCAFLDHILENVRAGQVIVFNSLITNDGDAYDTHTGRFTAPVTGVYLFMFHYNSNIGKAEIRLVRDSYNLVGSVVSQDNAQALMGSNSAILHVRVGQSVWVETYVTTAEQLDSWPSFHKTTFSGALLYRTFVP